MADLTKTGREELIRKVMDRTKDLQKFDLIKLVCESYSKGEFGDDPLCDSFVAETVLSFIKGVLTNDVSKVRKAMSTLKTEKFLSRLAPYKLEKLFDGRK